MRQSAVTQEGGSTHTTPATTNTATANTAASTAACSTDPSLRVYLLHLPISLAFFLLLLMLFEPLPVRSLSLPVPLPLVLLILQFVPTNGFLSNSQSTAGSHAASRSIQPTLHANIDRCTRGGAWLIGVSGTIRAATVRDTAVTADGALAGLSGVVVTARVATAAVRFPATAGVAAPAATDGLL